MTSEIMPREINHLVRNCPCCGHDHGLVTLVKDGGFVDLINRGLRYVWYYAQCSSSRCWIELARPVSAERMVG